MNLFRNALTNTAGKLAPGLVNGGAIIDGNYTQLAGADLEIAIEWDDVGDAIRVP